MPDKSGRLISFVIPLYNEEANILKLHANLMAVIEANSINYEVIYCDDGSTDRSAEHVKTLYEADKNVKLICFSRNFGKESALSAGIAKAKGAAIIMLDSDGQHPVEKIPDFIAEWHKGAQVVIGVGAGGREASWLETIGSNMFQRTFNHQLVPGSTDFRLIDKSVQSAFLQLKETDRITRGLIDWLGFKRAIVNFRFKPREYGEVTYSSRKRLNLYANSFVSLTPVPLYIFGYVGIIITTLSTFLGLAVIIEQLLLNDPLNWNFTGTAMLGIITIFLVGLVLMSVGILSLYISRMQNQSRQRPLYVVDESRSIGLK